MIRGFTTINRPCNNTFICIATHTGSNDLIQKPGRQCTAIFICTACMTLRHSATICIRSLYSSALLFWFACTHRNDLYQKRSVQRRSVSDGNPSAMIHHLYWTSTCVWPLRASLLQCIHAISICTRSQHSKAQLWHTVHVQQRCLCKLFSSCAMSVQQQPHFAWTYSRCTIK